MLQSFGLCDTGKPLVYHVLKDLPISTCRRLETVVLDMTRREYADLRKKVDELNALLMNARIKDGSPVENMNPFLRGFNGD